MVSPSGTIYFRGIPCTIQSTPVIPSQCRNTGVGIRLSFVQAKQQNSDKEMRIATPVTSVTGSQ